MKRKKYKILACALSMGLAFTPNAALAAGTGLSEADEANLEEDVDDSWEDEESEDVEDDFWEDEESEDMEDGSWEDEEFEDVENDFSEDEESEDVEDDFWEDEESVDMEDGSWEDEEFEDVEDDFWDTEDALPVMMCCGMEADELAGAIESEPESVDADDGGVEGTTENAEVTKSQEENGMPYIAGTQGRNYYKAEDAESRDDTIAGVYTPLRKTQLYASAGVEDTAFLEVDENTKIHCYGYYTEADGAKWYYVQYFQNGRSFIGFCSSEELK